MNLSSISHAQAVLRRSATGEPPANRHHRRIPQIACHSCDLPIVRSETIDFLTDEFPATSLIAMVAIECFPDPDRDRDAGGVVVAPGGIVEFGDSFSLTGADFIRWCAEAGFARCEVLPLAGAARATVAYK